MTDNPDFDSHDLKRYAKQYRFPGIGVEGQRRIGASRVVLIGCGALGSASANLLARAGVGDLLIVDRDFVELDNLQRQVLYNESDIGLPKAVVATKKLRAINSQISIFGKVMDVDFRNIESLILQPRRADVVLDGTDNFEIRFLINDACVQTEVPWIYGGCLGCEGQVMNIVPRETGCLNCLMLDGPPAPGSTATCDSSGILSTIINVVASFQVNEALKLLSGNRDRMSTDLNVFDLWSNRNHQIDVSNLRDKVDCPTCMQEQFSWLSGKLGSQSTVLCGRNAVQVSLPERSAVDLGQLANRLRNIGRLEENEFMIRCHIDDQYILNVFQDGRAIINGTEDLVTAKKLYSQYIGA